jgi:hypothetical protein
VRRGHIRQDVAAGASLQASRVQLVLGVRGRDQDLVTLGDATGGVESVQARHFDVHQHYVGPQPLDLVSAATPLPASPTTLGRAAREGPPHAGAAERVVIAEQ